MRIILLLSLSLGLCAGETAIHGIVLDPSGRAVEAARVTCAKQSVYTNAEGRFTILGPDACTARIEKAGFEPRTAGLNSNAQAQITLMVAGPVENVVVSANRTETTPEQAAIAASVIDEQQLSEQQFPMLYDALREIPGLQISESGPPGALAEVFTRGADSTGTLVLLDGVPLNDPGGSIHLENLTTDGLDRVEIVRGPDSALYGAEAAAGVIQLFTKHGNPEDRIPHGSVSYERGSFQTDRWIANLTGGLPSRFDYSLSASEFHTVGEWPNTYYLNNSGTADLGYKFSDSTQLRAVFHAYAAHNGVPGQIAYGVDDQVPNEETRDNTVGLRLDDSRGAHFHQQFSFGYHRLNDQYNDHEPYSQQPLAALVRNVPDPPPATYFVTLVNPYSPPTVIPPGLMLVQTAAYFGPYSSLNTAERKIAGYQGTLSYKGGALVFGYDYQDQSGFLSGVNASRDNNGLFVNLQQNFGDRIFLSGGARYEHSSAFGNIGSGRAGASILLTGRHGPVSSTYFRLSGGRGVTEPSLLENYADMLPYEIGNPALRPQTTTTFEAALVSEWWASRIRTEIAGFRNSFRNLIAYVAPTWENIEASWARGVEMSARAQVNNYISLNGSYMLLHTDITASTTPDSFATGIGEPLLLRPRNSGSLSLAVTPKRWSFVIGGSFIGERQDSDFLGFGVTRNPGYQNIYAAASYDLAKHFTPILRADNLLNENYQEVLGYPALSRSMLGGLRIHW